MGDEPDGQVAQIGHAAAELDMPALTIRFYEKNELIRNERAQATGGGRIALRSVSRINS